MNSRRRVNSTVRHLLLPMRRVFQIITAGAFIASFIWFIRHPQYDSGVAGLTTLGVLIGLFVEQRVHQGKEADRKLFQQFKQVLPSNGSIDFIDKQNMAGFSFHVGRLDDLYKFLHTWNDAEHEFLDKKLEEKRQRLLKLIAEYSHLIGMNTWQTHLGLQTVPPEWEDEQPERFLEVVTSLHDKAREIVVAHQDLVRAARRKLEG
jgi:hypothetical protein